MLSIRENVIQGSQFTKQLPTFYAYSLLKHIYNWIQNSFESFCVYIQKVNLAVKTAKAFRS